MLNCSALGEEFKSAEIAFCKMCVGEDITISELVEVILACYTLRRMQADKT